MAVREFDYGITGRVLETDAAADVAVNFKDATSNDYNAKITGGGLVEAAAGTVSAPSHTFASDTDTGIFRKTTNTIAVTAGGTEMVTANATQLSFYGATLGARPTAYTQTYATSDKTFSSYSADAESVVYSGGSTDSALALVADLNSLRVAYENLRAFVEDHAKLTNAVIDDLQSLGLFQ